MSEVGKDNIPQPAPESTTPLPDTASHKPMGTAPKPGANLLLWLFPLISITLIILIIVGIVRYQTEIENLAKLQHLQELLREQELKYDSYMDTHPIPNESAAHKLERLQLRNGEEISESLKNDLKAETQSNTNQGFDLTVFSAWSIGDLKKQIKTLRESWYLFVRVD